jgi:peptidyl-tRNA hydrolase, PTH1 family
MSENPSTDNAPWLVAGLGNPGRRYAGTRHNIGFVVLDELARRHGLRFSAKQANSEIARGTIEGRNAILAKPQTYMNNSGLAVGWLARYYKVPLDRLLVVYDDFALPLGTIRIRGKGSAGGHNGLTSVIQHMGTQNFPRLRVGVDHPVVAQHSHIDWVLGHFNKEEKKTLEEVVPRCLEAIEAIMRDGLERAMNVYNTSPSTPGEEGELKIVIKKTGEEKA